MVFKINLDLFRKYLVACSMGGLTSVTWAFFPSCLLWGWMWFFQWLLPEQKKKKSCSLKTRYLYFSWGTAFLLSLINPEGTATIALYLGPVLMCLQLLSIPLNNWFFYSLNLFGCCCIILSYLIFTTLCWTDTHDWISYMLMSHLFELIEKCLVEHFPFNKW